MDRPVSALASLITAFMTVTLESEGVRFSDDGVRLQRTAPVITVLQSEGAAA
jgi:hypothetical protein